MAWIPPDMAIGKKAALLQISEEDSEQNSDFKVFFSFYFTLLRALTSRQCKRTGAPRLLQVLTCLHTSLTRKLLRRVGRAVHR